MKTYGIKRLIWRALDEITSEISGTTKRGGMYARGSAGEGYAGGYRDALNDVLLALNGVLPERRNYWRKKQRGE